MFSERSFTSQDKMSHIKDKENFCKEKSQILETLFLNTLPVKKKEILRIYSLHSILISTKLFPKEQGRKRYQVKIASSLLVERTERTKIVKTALEGHFTESISTRWSLQWRVCLKKASLR